MKSPFSAETSVSPLRVIGTLAAVGLLAYLLSRQGWSDILQAIRQIPIWRFGLAFLFMLISRAAVAGRWHVLLRSAGVKMTLQQTTRLTFAGLFASNFLPTTVGGDVVRMAGAIRIGGSRAIGASSVVVDRLIGLAGMATASPFALGRLWMWLSPGSTGLPLAAGFTILPVARWRKWVSERGVASLRKVGDALAVWSGNPGALLGAYAVTWVHMLGKFISIWIVYDSLGQQLPVWLIGGLWSLTYFITLFPVSINGLGIQEVSMAFIFSNLGGAALPTALTAALLVRTLEMAASLPGALFLPGFLDDFKRGRAVDPAE